MKTDGYGRNFVCQARSVEGDWQIQVYGPNEYCNFLYAYAQCTDGWQMSFSLGYPAEAGQIEFRWDLPNGSWGIFISGQCWAFYVNRPALRMHPRRIYSHVAPYQKPFTEDEIRFLCARKRFQKKGTRGGILEE